jgi:DNA-binding beta-propeller fold protein YncE
MLLLAAVTACGGGGGGGNTQDPTDPPVEPPVDPPPDPDPDPGPVTGAFACGSAGASEVGTTDNFVLFESGAVRPLALSADGTRLLFTNTPANCLEIYTVSDSGFELESAVMVGLEPVAVAFRDDNEAWVVNHLSDSISIVELGAQPRVTQTLQVGDEPRDIVFAGPQGRRAFITAAYRGQNHPSFRRDDLTTAGLGRADVWVFDATATDQSLNGNPLAIINLFADTPRALAASADGATVYAAAFTSGNQSTTLSADVVAGAKPAPAANHDGQIAPETGLIVRKQGAAWVDEDGTDWSSELRLDLPDLDVFEIDAMAATPAVVSETSGVGSTLFNMVVNPVSGEVYVSNLEALNHIRFEGPGEFADTTVRGRIAESRITVIDDSGVTANHLNPHVDFDVSEGSSYPADVVARSLSQPTALAVSPDGETLYVAAFGSGKVAAIPTDELHAGSYTPDAALQVTVPGGGPVGLVLSPDGERAIVYSRFDHSISLWNTANGQMLAQRTAFSPEPAQIVTGRRFLYDAVDTSANGTSACSSCHIFGDMDQLAWDLGNPDGDMQQNPNEYVPVSPKTTFFFHPMKGPMTTQTLRGIADSGPQHWRGDRTGENRVVVDGELESLEAAAFKEFNPAFVGLVGRATELPTADMQAFTEFAMALTPPPNPVRRLDNKLTAAEANGRDIYFNVGNITGIGSCNHCHDLDPQQKHFGTAGLMSFEGDGIAENFKVPHIRNAYAKVGMFGTSGRLDTTGFTGDQVKGFGYLHDGSIATLLDFFASPTFNFPAPEADNQADIVRFVMVADSNLAPIAGQQITIHADSSTEQIDHLVLLEERALVTAPLPECDLVARGVVDGLLTSAVMVAGDTAYTDTNDRSITPADLLAMAQGTGNSLTYTCVPPGTGNRLALDTP